MIWIKTAVTAIAFGILIAACSGASFSKEMTQGERLFRGNCNACHVLPDAKKYSDAEWPPLVNRYAQRTSLDSVQTRQIVEYLTSAN